MPFQAKTMEEPLARVEIREVDSDLFVATLWSEAEGTKELRAHSLDALWRELTMDLEFMAGQHAGDSRGVELSAEEEFENLQFAQEWE